MNKEKKLILLILTLGVFGVVTTQLGVVGILPLVADHFNVSISRAGLMVSLFALAVAVSAPTLPLFFSRINRKNVMLLILGIFALSNIIAAFAPNFIILLIAYVFPAFFHPIYVSMALSSASASVSKEEAPKAVSRVFIGVSACMVIGVPFTNFIANSISVEYALIFFAALNLITLILTVVFIPSMPVSEILSYGEQLSVLKKPVIWLSIAAVIFLNGSVFGVYSYLAEYLEIITKIPSNMISLLLLVYGAANIIGNIISGKLLTKNGMKTVAFFPFAIGAVYVLLFLLGSYTVPMIFTILLWGILGGIGGVINQYWITTAASKAPDFANGLFLTSANLGTTFGTTLSGLFITRMGTQYVVFGGLIFLTLSIILILTRIFKYESKKVVEA